jgi:hypothetical protein
MTGLTPAATYYYSYGSDAGGWSPVAAVRALDPPAAATPLHLALVADMGMTEVDGSEGAWVHYGVHEFKLQQQLWVCIGNILPWFSHQKLSLATMHG